jgi:hypothetical protein
MESSHTDHPMDAYSDNMIIASRARSIGLSVGLLAAIAALVWLGLSGPSDPAPATGPPATAELATDRLVGDWVRDDGGYTLRIRAVEPDGTLDAAYLNPNRINVAVAKATHDRGSLRLYVEMRDVGYPGSHYNLVYNTQDDVLAGTYYQALASETYEVIFRRVQTR